MMGYVALTLPRNSVADWRHVNTHITGVLGEVREVEEYSVGERIHMMGSGTSEVQCSVY